MNKITDTIIATQLCTAVAAALTFVAHLLESGAILNPNWHWAIYLCLVIAMFFMLIPHLMFHDKPYVPSHTDDATDERCENEHTFI